MRVRTGFRRWRPGATALTLLLCVAAFMSDVAGPRGASVARAQATSPAPLNIPRSGFGAATGANGRVYVYSGSGSGVTQPQGTLEEYDPAANVWHLRAPAPCQSGGGILDGALAAATNGRLYVVGHACGKTLEYDPASNTWAERAPVPTPRVLLAAVGATNGKIYAIGGLLDGGTGAALGLVQEYDPATDTWATRSPMPTPRGGARAVAAGGKIYVLGGRTQFGRTSANEAYDPATDSWVAGAAMPTDSTDIAAAATLDGAVLLTVSDASPEHSVQRYDPATNTWEARRPLPDRRVGHRSATLVNGWILVVGGLLGATPTGTVLAYDPAVDGWYPDTDLPSIQSIGIDGGAVATASLSVTLSLQATDASSGISSMRFSNDGTTWSDWEPYAPTSEWTLAPGDGQKSVFGQVRDTVGNVSATATDTIVFDTAPPALASTTVNGGALVTTSTRVSLALQATDPGSGSGVQAMSFSNDGTTWSPWEPFAATTDWTVPAGTGPKTVHARVRDAAGNVSGTVADRIVLDTTVGPTFGISINNAAIWTNTVDVTLTIPAAPGTAQMMLSNDGGFGGAAWEPYDSRKRWRLDRFEGSPVTMIVYVRFGDAVGNELPDSRSFDNIILDIEPPTGSVTVPNSPVVRQGGVASPLREVQLTATDNLSGDGMQVRLANRADFAGAVWRPFTSAVTWDFSGGGTVYVQFRDGAGNVSQVYSQSLPGAQPPGTSPAPVCSPRPPVTVTVQPSNGALAVTLAATGANNGLRAVRFDSFANAVVDVGDQRNQSAPFAVSIPPGLEPTTLQLTVRRQAPGAATTVRLVVIDGCGEWSTFVGGGPAAF